jgi:hypothetical protein
MITALLSFVLIALIMLAMAIGVIFTGRRLRGSCGGAAGCHCRGEGTSPTHCERNRAGGATIQPDVQIEPQR